MEDKNRNREQWQKIKEKPETSMVAMIPTISIIILNVSIIRGIISEDLMHSMVTIVNNTVLHIGKLLRVDLQSSQHKKKIL